MEEPPSDVDLEEGQTLDNSISTDSLSEGSLVRYVGDYEIEEEIARGGMGIVFRARQKSLGRVVALKMILRGQLASEIDVARFRVEAEAAAALSHPGIVAIHEIGIHEGQPYFSMDFIEGQTLERIGNGSPIDPERTANYALQIAQAMSHAHEQNVLHRDLKPSNVLLDGDDRVRITDFGLARRMVDSHGLTSAGSILGTPAYMAPEQACGRETGATADVYSIGAILYELITGRAPFVAETPLAVLMEAQESEPPRPEVLNRRVPTDLATICSVALSRNSENRFESAQGLADDLQRFLDKEPIHAKPAGLIRKLTSWTERNPWVITAGISMGAVLLICIAYGFFAKSQMLQWTIENPDSPRPSALGASSYLPYLESLYSAVAAGFLWIQMDFVRRSSGLSIRQFFNKSIPKVFGVKQFSSAEVSAFGAAVFFASLVLSASLKVEIDDFVWTGEFDGRLPFKLFLLLLAGCCAFAVVKEMRFTWQGVQSRVYTPAEKNRVASKFSVLIRRYMRIGKLKEAEEFTGLLQAISPERPEWMVMSAELQKHKGQKAQAAQQFQRAAMQAQQIGGYSDRYIQSIDQMAKDCAE